MVYQDILRSRPMPRLTRTSAQSKSQVSFPINTLSSCRRIFPIVGIIGRIVSIELCERGFMDCTAPRSTENGKETLIYLQYTCLLVLNQSSIQLVGLPPFWSSCQLSVQGSLSYVDSS